jgi:hypothetical protein
MTNLVVAEELIDAIGYLEDTTRKLADASVPGVPLNPLQYKAAVLVEQLKLIIGPVDYGKERLKGEILTQLETGDLWQYHPSSPASLDELVQEVGMSKSEKSDLLTWEKYIYPYLQEKLGLEPYQVWQMLNKTKRRRLTPYLRQLIDQEWKSDSDRVVGTAEKLKNGVDNVPDQNLAAVKRLLTLAENLTSRDLEEEISPEPTPAIEMDGTRHRVVTIDNETGEILGETVRYKLACWVTEDQLNLLRRRFPDRLSLAIAAGDDICITASGEEDERLTS